MRNELCLAPLGARMLQGAFEQQATGHVSFAFRAGPLLPVGTLRFRLKDQVVGIEVRS